MGLRDLLVGLGFVLVIEGCAYALAPGVLKSAMRQALELPEGVLRFGGLAAAALGVLWLALLTL